MPCTHPLYLRTSDIVHRAHRAGLIGRKDRVDDAEAFLHFASLGWFRCDLKTRSYYMYQDMSAVAPPPMLPEENALPGTEPQMAPNDGNRDARRSQRRLDVRRHVIGAFRSMRKEGVVFLHETIEPVLQVATGGRVRILLNNETRRGVLHHHGAEPDAHTGLSHRGLDLVGDLVQALATRGNGNTLNHGVAGALVEKIVDEKQDRAQHILSDRVLGLERDVGVIYRLHGDPSSLLLFPLQYPSTVL